jgi:KaiC/GvpD/RAD55 family RecA-like ATPase
VKAARMVEGTIARETGKITIDIPKITLPIKPDRVAADSLSALSIAFKNEENYRKYVKELFDMLSEFNSVNYVLSETEQNPRIFSRTGVEEFLADGVVVLYNLRVGGKRQNALEILKMRAGKHLKKMVPYKLGKNGVEVFFDEKIALK